MHNIKASLIACVLVFLVGIGVADALITRTLSFGMRGSDVLELQTFLIAQGLLAPDSATGYFGSLTQAAVQAFQREQGIVSSGTPETTGYGVVGPRTRARINEMLAAGAGPAVAGAFVSDGGNTGGVRYAWYAEPWGSCVSGVQKRTVSCRGSDGKTYSNTFCTGTAPQKEQNCTTGSDGTNMLPCMFNGQAISHGASVTAYQSASVSAPQTCAQQTRICTNGTLSGTYVYGVCTVVASAPTVPTIVSGALKRSDILLSPRNSNWAFNNWSSAFSSFLANRVVWSYIGPRIIPQATSQNIPVQCALEFWVPASHPERDSMICRDANGVPKTADGTPTGTPHPDITSDAWRRYALEKNKAYVDGGCTSFEQDGPFLNYTDGNDATGLYGCYASSSIAQFRASVGSGITVNDVLTKTGPGGTLRTQWQEFQKKSVREYHDWLHQEINTYAKTRYPQISRVLFSANIHTSQIKPELTWLKSHFDFTISEVSVAGSLVNNIRKIAQEVASMPSYVHGLTFVTGDTYANQRSVASAYALGLAVIAPWDVFMSTASFNNCSPNAQGVMTRYCADPSQFAHYFGLVQQNRALFDDYTLVSEGYGTHPSVTLAGTPSPSSYLITVRASGTKRIVHLVNWGAVVDPLTVRLRKSDFPTPPNAVVRPGVGARDITPQDDGTYYTYTITGGNLWTMLFSRPDVTPPSIPTNLRATTVASTSITVAWDPSTDNTGVVRYLLERCTGVSCTNFVQNWTPVEPMQRNTGLTPGLNYRYRVRAVDAAGNMSEYSTIFRVPTLSQ